MKDGVGGEPYTASEMQGIAKEVIKTLKEQEEKNDEEAP